MRYLLNFGSRFDAGPSIFSLMFRVQEADTAREPLKDVVPRDGENNAPDLCIFFSLSAAIKNQVLLSWIADHYKPSWLLIVFILT